MFRSDDGRRPTRSHSSVICARKSSSRRRCCARTWTHTRPSRSSSAHFVHTLPNVTTIWKSITWPITIRWGSFRGDCASESAIIARTSSTGRRRSSCTCERSTRQWRRLACSKRLVRNARRCSWAWKSIDSTWSRSILKVTRSDARRAIEGSSPTLGSRSTNWNTVSWLAITFCPKADQPFLVAEAGTTCRTYFRPNGIEATFCCEQCDKKFLLKSHLALHQKKHISLTCEKCNQTFKNKFNLKWHEFSHLEIDPKCSNCAISFTSEQKFAVHLKKKICTTNAVAVTNGIAT